MRASIDVQLEFQQALAIVEASFEADRNWIIDRRAGGLRIAPGSERNLLEPDPGPILAVLPETLALRVDARAIGPATTQVETRVIRRLAPAVAAFLADLVASFGFGSMIHAQQMFELRREREAAKKRMLRLAIEPLQPYQCARDLGPFRRGHAGR